MTLSRRIAAPFGLCQDGSLKRNFLLELSSDGTIISLDFEVGNIDSIPRAEYFNGILIPSMTNAHCHLELSGMRGTIPEGTGLPVFFDYVSANFGKSNPAAISLQDRLMWNEGVSAVGDVSATDATFGVKAASSICYKTFVEYLGHGCKGNVGEYVSHKVGGLLEKCSLQGIDAIPYPHSTYLVSPEPFAYASQTGMLYTHFMESLSEIGFFEGKGEMYSYLKLTKPYPFNSAVDMVIHLLPSDSKLVLVHCTTITESDIVALESHFSDVTYVLCPSSNQYIERTVPPAGVLFRMGCKVAIGTDSLASNTSLSMAKEIALISQENPSIPLEVLLSWATAGGAVALGYEGKFGYFRKGIRSGVVLASGIDLNTKQIGQSFKLERIV